MNRFLLVLLSQDWYKANLKHLIISVPKRFLTPLVSTLLSRVWHYLKAFNNLNFHPLLCFHVSRTAQVSPYLSTQSSLVQGHSPERCGVYWLFHPSLLFFQDQKSSVVIWFSGRSRDLRGHTSFRHVTNTIHVAFPSCLIYLSTRVLILLCPASSVNFLPAFHQRNLRAVSKSISYMYTRWNLNKRTFVKYQEK